MKRRYIEVEGRLVLYRRAGSGPPLVMLHGSPGNSAMLEHEIAAASRDFTCFALDTPGFGGSDPLPGDTLTVADLACATVAAMAALGLPPCPVYGTHTGAAIAIEVGVGWPERATGLVLEGLPIFTEEEIAANFPPEYFAPFVTDPLAGHLTRTWVRFRDQFTWFPWLSRDVIRRNPVDRPGPADIHLWVSMFYRSGRTYGPAYRAACHYGHGAYEAAQALTLPAIYMASAEDMLYPHLDRLPPLTPGQRVAALPHDPAAKPESIVAFVHSLPQASAAPLRQPATFAGSDPAVQFLDTDDGQLFLRRYGHPASPALVLLHDAPGSGMALDELARALARDHLVLLPDLPGCGESDDPGQDDILAASASAIRAMVDALDLERFTLAAIGCGCAVAAQLAADPRVTEILLQDPPRPSPAIAAGIAPDLPLSPEGAHWITAWLMVRDAEIYTPWFDGTVAAQKTVQGDFDADRLHERTVEIMKARTSYHRLPRAAWTLDTPPLVAAAAAPVRIGPIIPSGATP